MISNFLTKAKGFVTQYPRVIALVIVTVGVLWGLGIFGTQAAWYSSTGDGPTWQYRQKITIDADQIDSDLTDFPVYLDLADFGPDFFSNVKNDGGDIRIAKSDGTTELAREVVSINTASSTGEVHFKADNLSSTIDNNFYIYYGSDGATAYADTDTFGTYNVWTEYEAVWHLNEDPGGVSPQMLDATGNGYDLEARGSMTSADLVDDHLGKAIELDGSGDYFSTPTSFNTYPATAGEIRYTSAIISNIPSNNKGGIVYFSAYNGFAVFDGGLFVHSAGDNSGTDTSASQVDDGNRYHVAAVFNQANEYRLYRNGVQVLQKNITDTEASNDEIWVGKQNAGTSILDARMSEVRWSKKDLGSNWATTEHNNQNDNAAFWVATEAVTTPTATARRSHLMSM